jgi:hypothetical protein
MGNEAQLYGMPSHQSDSYPVYPDSDLQTPSDRISAQHPTALLPYFFTRTELAKPKPKPTPKAYPYPYPCLTPRSRSTRLARKPLRRSLSRLKAKMVSANAVAKERAAYAD